MDSLTFINDLQNFVIPNSVVVNICFNLKRIFVGLQFSQHWCIYWWEIWIVKNFFHLQEKCLKNQNNNYPPFASYWSASPYRENSAYNIQTWLAHKMKTQREKLRLGTVVSALILLSTSITNNWIRLVRKYVVDMIIDTIL